MVELASFDARIYKRIVIQARYHTNFVLLEKARAVCQDWVSRNERTLFPRWGINETSLELINPHQHRRFYVAAKSSGAEWENLLPGDLKQELQLGQGFLNDLAECVPGLIANRLGIRFYYLVPVEEWNTLRAQLVERCTRWDDFATALGGKDPDMSMAWQFNKAAARVNCHFGPVRHDELGQWFQTTELSDVQRQRPERFIPKAALFFDADYAYKECKLSQTRKIVDDAIKELDGLLTAFLSSMGTPSKERL